MATDLEKAPEALQQLVAETDTGGRKPTGAAARVIFTVSLAWALFQLWYASPLPFTFGVGILNDTEARALHLGFALFLAFTAWPAFQRSPRDRVPVIDWALALAGAGATIVIDYVADPNSTLDVERQIAGLGQRALGVDLEALRELWIAEAELAGMTLTNSLASP